MSLIGSLLRAIVSVDGEALVMHASETPYVIAPSGRIDLASRGLTLAAVTGILNQLLTAEYRNALEEFGAVEFALPPEAELPDERFTVVAAREDHDAWVEIRRRLVSNDDRLTHEIFAAGPPAVKAIRPATPAAALRPAGRAPVVAPTEPPRPPAAPVVAAPAPAREVRPPAAAPGPGAASGSPVSSSRAPVPPRVPPDERAPLPVAPADVSSPVAAVAAPAPHAVSPRLQPAPAAPPLPSSEPPNGALARSDEHHPWLHLDRADPVAPRSGLDRLLRAAASRRASTLYLSSDARPSIRVDGEIRVLENEPVLASGDVVSLLLALMPERSHEALRLGTTTEWICDLEDLCRVRCMTFSDHRGPGGVFRLMPIRAAGVEELRLSREVQSLAIEPEGLVLVAGPRSSGKRTLIASLVDLVNRTRRDHVVTIEREVNIVHPRGNSFISQREVRGGDEDMLATTRAALREDPDVIVLERIRTGALMNVALEAAADGRLVIGGFSAHNATESVDRIIDLYAPEYARQVQLALARNLRGVIAQVLLPKRGGGRVAAREVLLNTPAVAGVIAEGKTSQLPMAIEAGRRQGMVPLGDSIVSYVQDGTVDVRNAYRQVSDRPGFVALLERHGIDTAWLSLPS